MAKKKKSKLKKFGAALAAGLAGAALLGRNRDKGVMTADMDRSMVPMDKRMVKGLNFPASTNLSGMSDVAARGTIDEKDYDVYGKRIMAKGGRAGHKKGGRVGVGVAKRGFGRAMKGRK